MKVALITTTLGVPRFLEKYIEAWKRYPHANVRVSYIVVGDEGAHSEAHSYCAQLSSTSGADVAYITPIQQSAILDLHNISGLADIQPYRTIERGRNFGLLLAYKTGIDVALMIDDDNLASGQDFLRLHLDPLVNPPRPRKYFHSTSGWMNVCSVLVEKNGTPFYHRGYPQKERWNDGYITHQNDQRQVVVNAGLWLGDPDIDAVTRLERKLEVVDMKLLDYLHLSPGTWCPFDNQNTAICREAMPAYFLSTDVGRYSDIWASYVLRRIIDHLGHAVSYGQPLCDHQRGERNLIKDLQGEVLGMQMTDNFCKVLRRIPLHSKSYIPCFKELTSVLKQWWKGNGIIEQSVIDKYIKGMEVWSTFFECM